MSLVASHPSTYAAPKVPFGRSSEAAPAKIVKTMMGGQLITGVPAQVAFWIRGGYDQPTVP